MLKAIKDERTLKENLMLASSTAFVAGVTNVAGMLAFSPERRTLDFSCGRMRRLSFAQVDANPMG